MPFLNLLSDFDVFRPCHTSVTPQQGYRSLVYKHSFWPIRDAIGVWRHLFTLDASYTIAILPRGCPTRPRVDDAASVTRDRASKWPKNIYYYDKILQKRYLPIYLYSINRYDYHINHIILFDWSLTLHQLSIDSYCMVFYINNWNFQNLYINPL